jgi:uncharacterized protein with ParB-like and HNH nuclease domain
VWSNKDKSSFLETVLLNYPFPEVYVAAGDVDVETGEGTELLVDGQQRLTTLFQYFNASPDLVLVREIEPYASLPRERKEAFLQYDVVVRDLGCVDLDVIRNVFQRINATRYALNAMEIHNSRYEGAFKQFAEDFAQRAFFEQHRVFSAAEIRRMQDVRFVLVLATTVLSTYFNRDDEIEDYLKRYNDDFPHRSETERELDRVVSFVEEMRLPDSSRAWKKADLFTLFVELHRRLCKESTPLSAAKAASALEALYRAVDDPDGRSDPNSGPARYYKAALQATNDRSSRITRGEIVRKILAGAR